MKNYKEINFLIEQALCEIAGLDIVDLDNNGKNLSNQMSDRLKTLSDYAKSDDPNLNKNLKRQGVKFKKQVANSFISPDSFDLGNTQTIRGNYNQKMMEDDLLDALNLLRKYASNGTIAKQKMLKDGYHEYEIHRLEATKLFIDEKSLTYLYDKTLKNKKPDSQFKHSVEIDPETGDIVSFKWDLTQKDVNRNRKGKNLRTVAETYKNLLDRYLKLKFGIDFEVSDFSTGNMKVPNTLIINFASAMGCPAWNRCVVKHACYARSGERRYKGALPANERKRLMWLTASVDSEFRNLLFSFLRNIAINFSELWGTLDNEQKSIFGSLDDFIKTPFKDMPQEVKEVIKNGNFIKVRNVRFNENGDFLNQRVLMMVDGLAGDFNEIGITCSAYTCRNLNYDKIKNIILNGSQVGLNTGKLGDTQFARIFYAVPSIIYKALEITCREGSGNELVKTPLLIEGTRSMFYKCPCAQNIGSIKKVMCGSCNYCYEFKEKGSPLDFIIVSAHGANAYDLDVATVKAVLQNIGVLSDLKRLNAMKNNLIIEAQSMIKNLGDTVSYVSKRGKNKGKTIEKKVNLTPNQKKDIEVIKDLFTLIFSISEDKLINFPYEIPLELQQESKLNNKSIIAENNLDKVNLESNSKLAIGIVTEHAIESMRQITKEMVMLDENKNNFFKILENITRTK